MFPVWHQYSPVSVQSGPSICSVWPSPFCPLSPCLPPQELRSVLSPLLEASALLSPVAQAHVLWQLAQAVGVIRTQSPAVFKAPLVRLFGTAHAALLHASLRLKALFTDSLFTAEDEAFLLRRLVALAGHPALPSPLRLFYLDCLLCFPENRPLGSEGVPVLLTPRLAASLVPSVFQDPGTVLARCHLFSLVCLENPGPEADRGVGVLFEQLLALAGVVAGWGAAARGGASEGGWDLGSRGVQDGGPGVGWDRGSAGVQDWGSVGGRGAREAAVLFFRSAYLFVRYFGSQAGHGPELAAALARLYGHCPALAPHFLNLLAETRAALDDPAWPAALAGALQELIVGQPPRPRDLPWHLRVLSHVAGAPGVPVGAAASYVQRLACLARAGRLGGWRPGQALLGVCRTLLQRPGGAGPPLAALLEELAWGYPDVDVQHRARFYRALLASLGAEKLGAVLAPAGRLQARTLSSSLVAESESFTAALTVHPAPHVPLRLERQALPAAGAPLRVRGVAEVAAEISTPAAPLPLSLGYRVLHAGDPPEPLLCLLLRFEAGSGYGPVPDIHVPCLRAGHPPPALTLQLQPRAPYPTRVEVTALYSTPGGLTYSCRLAPLEVSFPDLFQPLALPPDWDLPTRRHLFQALWDALGPGAESLVSWAQLQQPVASLVESVFARYLVAPGSGACEVGLALPPRHRVLLRAREATGGGAACVALRTDHWGALPLLGKYLREVGGEGG
ncbi:AP-5 complex subunit beta-1 [Alligator mississippiensis]|uniref:AP-5 complex subunit beta-1 n=1 Tax=Alligator mississippiensis TaxID=8496 RepID=A0A151NWR7_ALLMI|nr:AP-5 complex subunit beta-1 [Alligator mississippiensis]